MPAERRSRCASRSWCASRSGCCAGVCGFLGIDFRPGHGRALPARRGAHDRRPPRRVAHAGRRQVPRPRAGRSGRGRALAGADDPDDAAWEKRPSATRAPAELGYRRVGAASRRSPSPRSGSGSSTGSSPGTAIYNIPSAARACAGRSTSPCSQRCFDEIAAPPRGRCAPASRSATAGRVQVVDPPSRRPLPLVDLAALPEARRAAEAAAPDAARRPSWPFDLARGPLLPRRSCCAWAPRSTACS